MKIENIKFKAKRIDGKGWVCGYFYEENGNTYIIENRQKESKLNRNPTYQVDPSTVCQFTGLIDCEGNEIWEHDLIHFVGISLQPKCFGQKRTMLLWQPARMNLFICFHMFWKLVR